MNFSVSDKNKAFNFYSVQFQRDHYAQSGHNKGHLKFIRSFFKEKEDVLSKGKILEIGCGRGHLQNLAEGYIGIDIALTAGKNFRKPFICALAEALPFRDETFDAVMSFKVLEHIIKPETTLSEMVRVLRKGGLLIMDVSWRVPPWRPLGLEMKLYSDISLPQKLLKVTFKFLDFFWTKRAFSNSS